MTNLTNNARRSLRERQAVHKNSDATTRPGSLNPRKGGAPAGRNLRNKAKRQAASRAASL